MSLANLKKKTTKSKSKQLKYEDITEIVEYLVKTKSWNYTFDCYSPEDIAQEIRLICFKVLTHFDAEKVEEGKRVNFFGRCVDNALKNLKRDKYIRYSSPCDGDCEMFHRDDKELSIVCKKWLKHQDKIKRKRNIRHPISIELLGDIRDTDFEKQIETDDIKRFLLDRVDKSLKPALLNIFNGNKKSVSIRDRRKVQIFVKRILQE